MSHRNSQLPEPPLRGDGQTLDLHSVFLTIQGEGPFSGRRAVFIRLAGCNLQCPGCDTEYTKFRRPASIHDIAAGVHQLAGEVPAIVVITGGEPLRQPIGRLVRLLLAVFDVVQIESNGTVPPDEVLRNTLDARLCWLVVSPKTLHINDECYKLAAAFKYVLHHGDVSEADGLPTVALDHLRGKGVARPRVGAPVYLTPYDTGDDDDERLNAMAVAQSCIRFGYHAGLQIHKYMDLK